MNQRRLLSEIVWGKPDSPRRPLCARCHVKLPEVPLIIWKEDGSAASFCDPCAELVFKTLFVPKKPA